VTGLPSLRDLCPSCLDTAVTPYLVTPGGTAGHVRADYACRCGHTWWCGWAVSVGAAA